MIQNNKVKKRQDRNQIIPTTYFHQLEKILQQPRQLRKQVRAMMTHKSHTRHLMMYQPLQTQKGVSLQ